jgi:hypothetical protein
MSRRKLSVALLILLLAGVVGAQQSSEQTARPRPSQLFQKARGIPEAAPTAFEFELSGFAYRVAANGNGRRTKGDSTRRFNLRLDGDEQLRHVYFSKYEDDVLLVCEVSAAGSGAGFVMRLEQPSMRTLWKPHIPAPGVGEPFRDGAQLYVTARGFVARLDLKTGGFVWQREKLYGRGRKDAFGSFVLPRVEGDEVLFKEQPVYNVTALTLVLNKKSGKIVRTE